MNLMTLEDYQKLQQEGSPEGASQFGTSSPSQPAMQSMPQDEGSVWDTAMSRLDAQKQSFFAANATDPELSNYQNKKARDSIAKMQEEQSKLGLVGNLAAGIVGAAPAIAGGIVNPFLGGAIAAGQGTLDTLVAQGENNRQFDMGKAGLAGAAMGAADALTGGLANRFRAGLPVASVAAKIGTNVAEDVTSNIASQAFENMGADKNWHDGLAEAGAFGAAGGAAVRGGLAGLNKAAGYGVNRSGQDSVGKITEMRNKGMNPDESFQGNVFGYNNMKEGMDVELAGTDLTPEGRAQAEQIINRQTDLAISEGGDAATMRAMEIFDKSGINMIDSGFNVRVPKGMSRDTGELVNIGEQIGLTEKQMRKAGITQQEARAGTFSKGSVERGLTKEADDLKFQEAYKTKAFGPARETMNTNVNYLDGVIFKAKQDGYPTEYLRKLQAVRDDLSQVSTLTDRYTGKDKRDVTPSMRNIMARVKPLVNELGLQKDLVGVDGKAGTWDPVIDMMTLDRMSAMAHSRMPSVEMGTPNPYGAAADKSSNRLGLAVDAGAVMSGNLWLPIARRAAMAVGGEMGARKSQRNLSKTLATGQKRLADVVSAGKARQAEAINQKMKAGDMEGASIDSADALNSSGIGTGELGTIADAPTVDTPPISTAAPEAPVTASVPRSDPVPARRPSQPVETPTEAPVASPAKSSREMAPTGKTKDATAKPAPEPEVTVVETLEIVEAPKAPSKLQVSAKKPESAQKPAKAPVEASKTPETKPTQPLPRKPTPPEKSPEAAPEAPAKVEAPEPKPEPVKPKGPDYNMARRELLERKSVLEKSSKGKTNSQELAGKIAVVNDQISTFNTETSRLAKSFSTDKDEISGRISKLGGIEKSMSDAKKLGMTTHDYLMGKIRDQISDEKDAAKQAAKKSQEIVDNATKKIDESIKEKSSEQASKEAETKWQREIANKQNQALRRLKASGYSDETIKEAMKLSNADIPGQDFDLTETMNYVRTLDKQKLQKAKDEAKAKAKADEIAAKKAAPKFQDSKRKLRTALNSLGMDTHPGVQDLFKKLTRGRDQNGKALSEAQIGSFLNKVDAILDAERSGLEKALKRSHTEQPEMVAKWKADLAESKQKAAQFERNKASLAQIEKSEKERLEVVQKTAKERAKADEELATLTEETSKRDAANEQAAKDAKAVDDQSKKLERDLKEGGVEEGIAQEVVARNFNTADKPLNAEKLASVKAEAAEAQSKVDKKTSQTAQETTKELKKDLGQTLDKVAPKALEDATEPLIGKALRTKNPAVSKAVFEAVAEAFSKNGMADHVKGVKAFQRAFDDSVSRKEKYPDNKELWISSDDTLDIQDALNSTSGKAYMGNLGMKLRSNIAGDTEYKPRYSRSEIKRKAESLEAKGILGDDDIRVGNKAVIRKKV